MRIVHILGDRFVPEDPDNAPASGAVRAALEIARAQAALGHDVSVATIDDRARTVQWGDVRLEYLKRSSNRLLRLGTGEVDLSSQVPYIWKSYLQNIDVVHSHLHLYLRFIRAKIRVVHLHTAPYLMDTSGARVPTSAADIQTLCRTSDVGIPVSQYVASEYAQAFESAEVRRPYPLAIVPNGVDCSRFDTKTLRDAGQRFRAELGITADDVVILFSGAMIDEKGCLELARAFSKLALQRNQVHLVMAGSANLWQPLSADLERRSAYEQDLEIELARASSQHRVHRLGSVPLSGMSALYGASDIVCVPSLWPEACPLVILEAMAAGRPVVASDCGGIPELVTNATGLLVTPGDVEALEGALGRMVDEPALRRSLGDAGRASVSHRTWLGVARALDEVYRGTYELAATRVPLTSHPN